MSIFRAYDIRGVVGETLTPDLVKQIAQAFGSEAVNQGYRRVVVGRDGRLSSPMLHEALVAGLQATGCHVVDIGCVPSPVLYFATYHLQTGTGIMVTGSHNPSQYNGLKSMLAGKTLAGEALQSLKARLESQQFVKGHGSVTTMKVEAIYWQRIVDDIQLQRPLKVVVDCGNGVAGAFAPVLFRQLGCEVIELFCEVDGHFPHHHPDPTVVENLQTLIATVRQHGADVGLGFDGDGDRLGVVDSKGKIIWADRQLMLYAIDILSRYPGSRIIYDVKCSRYLSQVIEQHGGHPIMWRTGHSLIKSKLQEENALLAGEMSGHIFFKERWYGFDDAMYTAARLLEILAKTDKSSADVFAQLPDAVSTPELKLNFAEEGAHFALMERIKTYFQFADAQITTIDGLRVDFADGWGLVRPSNTTSCLVIRFEAENEQALQRIKEVFRQQFLALEPSLSLPF